MLALRAIWAKLAPATVTGLPLISRTVTVVGNSALQPMPLEAEFEALDDVEFVVPELTPF
ncbi:hypothetical protein D3C71_1922170 [compost metagenome]